MPDLASMLGGMGGGAGGMDFGGMDLGGGGEGDDSDDELPDLEPAGAGGAPA